MNKFYKLLCYCLQNCKINTLPAYVHLVSVNMYVHYECSKANTVIDNIVAMYLLSFH